MLYLFNWPEQWMAVFPTVALLFLRCFPAAVFFVLFRSFRLAFLFLIEWHRRRFSKMWDIHGHRRETAWNQIWAARDVQSVVNIKSVGKIWFVKINLCACVRVRFCERLRKISRLGLLFATCTPLEKTIQFSGSKLKLNREFPPATYALNILSGKKMTNPSPFLIRRQGLIEVMLSPCGTAGASWVLQLSGSTGKQQILIQFIAYFWCSAIIACFSSLFKAGG